MQDKESVREKMRERTKERSVPSRMHAVDIFEATEKIRGVVDRVFRACRGAVGAQKKMLCRRAPPLYFRLII